MQNYKHKFFKSSKTHQQMSQIQVDDPVFEYNTKEAIDEKFNEFQKEYKKLNGLSIDSQITYRMNDNISKSMKNSQLMESQHQLRRRETEHLINNFAKNIINAYVIQSFYYNDDNFNNNNVKSVSKNIMNIFDINLNILNMKKTQEDKINYVVQQMTKVVNNNYKKYQKNVNNIKCENFQNKNMCQSQQNKQLNDWFQINSKFEGLQHQLKQNLVENIAEIENQNEAIKFLNQIEQMKANNQEDIKHQNFKLKNYQRQNTYQCLQNYLNQKNGLNNLEIQNTDIQPWSKETEAKYQNLNQYVKSIFNNELKHTNFGTLINAKMGYVQAELDNKEQSRETLMERFTNGDNLSESEILFLINTSQLLNSCIDKKFIKSVIDVIDKNQIQEMELALAEKILNNHYQIDSMIKGLRQTYFESKIQMQKKKMQRCESAYQLKQDQVEKRVIHERKKKMIQMMDKKQSQTDLKQYQKIKKELDQIYERQKKHQQLNLRQEVLTLEAELQEQTKEQYKEQQNIKRLTHKNDNFYTIQKKQLVQKSLIPQSKLMIQKQNKAKNLNLMTEIDNEKIQKQLKKQEQMIQSEQRTRNKIRSTHFFKQKKNFQTYFTGGPQKVSVYYQINQQKQAPIVLAKIIQIQKVVRMFLAKKQLQEKKNEKFTKQINEDILYIEDQINNTNKLSHIKQSEKIRFKCLDKRNSQKAMSVRQKSQQSLKLSVQPDYKLLKLQATKDQQDTDEQDQISTRFTSHHVNSLIKMTSPKDGQQYSNLQKKAIQPRQFNQNQLQLKHAKLFELSKRKNLDKLQNYGFIYFEHDVNIRDQYNMSPLGYACINNDFNFVKYLLGKKSDPNMKLDNGNTAMHYAFKTQNPDIIMLLMDQNGDLNILNDEKLTPLAYGDKGILRALNLTNGVCTLQSSKNNLQSDNNSLVQTQRVKMFEKDSDISLLYSFDKLQQPTASTVKKGKVISFEC